MGNPEGTFDTKLHDAVRYADLEKTKVALQQGYDPNLIGLYQWSPMHEAAYNGHTILLKLLLEKKGNPNKADYLQTRTPMHYASENGHLQCLQMLLNAGGQCDIKDESNQDCLDMATPNGRKILEKYRVRALMLSGSDEKSTADENDEGISHDQSPDNSAGQSSLRSSIDSASSDKNAVLGFVTMSVEYHSSKGTLKIRASQLSELLLPPPHTSMIHSIYIKSYLQPDKKFETKRKTEEVKVEGSEGHVHLKKQKNLGAHHVYTPMTFKFTRVLEYMGINSSIVNEKHLHVEVCVTQRYSHRSFLIGMFNMPLKTAVKKIVKEKVALIPCMNYTIPANMRVYSAADMQITSNRNVFYSNPNFRVMIPDNVDEDSEKAASNPDLQENEFLQSATMDVPGVYPGIPKLDLGNMVLDESGYDSEFQVSPPRERESPDSQKVGHKSANACYRANSASRIDEEHKSRSFFKSMKRRFSLKSKTVNQPTEKIEVTDLETEAPAEIKVETHHKELNQDDREKSTRKDKDHKQNPAENKESFQEDPCPEAPSWDYYDFPDEVPLTKVETPVVNKRASPVILPMETMLELRNPGKPADTAKSMLSKFPPEAPLTKVVTLTVDKRASPVIVPMEAALRLENPGKPANDEAPLTKVEVETPKVYKHTSPVIIPMEMPLEFKNPSKSTRTNESLQSGNVPKKASARSGRKSHLPVPGKAQYLVPSMIISKTENEIYKKNKTADEEGTRAIDIIEMTDLTADRSNTEDNALSEVKVVRPKIFNTRGKTPLHKIPPIKDNVKLQKLRETNTKEQRCRTEKFAVEYDENVRNSGGRQQNSKDSVMVVDFEHEKKDVINVQAGLNKDNQGIITAQPMLRNTIFNSENETSHSGHNQVIAARPKIRNPIASLDTQGARKPNRSKLFELLPDKTDIPQARTITRKARRKKETESKSGFNSQNTEPVTSGMLLPQSHLASKSNPHNSSRRKESKANSSSTIVDIDKLVMTSAGSHIVELEDDISITEILDNSQLFNETLNQSSMKGDVERGLDELPTKRFSPMKNVLPMQVYVDERIVTGLAESVITSTGKSNIPTTEL